MANDRICAVILAAGYSSRMGRFKPMLPIGGMPAIAMLAGAFKKAGITDLIAVTGYKHEFLKDILSENGITEAFNSDFAQGMFSSVKSGLQAVSKLSYLHEPLNKSAPEAFGGILLAPVDCPLVPDHVIGSIVEEHKKNPNSFIVPCFLGKKGHPLLIPSHLVEEILTYKGDQGLKGVTRRYEEDMIRIETECESVVLDMDTPEGYEQVLAYYDNRRKVLSGKAKPFSLKDTLLGRRLFLIRHGEIKQHAEKIFLGQKDVPLSEKGREQAKAAGARLAHYSITTGTIFSSDLSRAKETAEIIANTVGPRENPAYDNNIKPLTVTLTPDLREMALGEWDGRFISEIKSLYPDAYEKRGRNLIGFKFDNDSENFYDLQYRAIKCMNHIVSNHTEGDLVVVAHSGVIKVILSHLNNVSLAEGIRRKIEPGEVILWSFEGGC